MLLGDLPSLEDCRDHLRLMPPSLPGLDLGQFLLQPHLQLFACKREGLGVGVWGDKAKRANGGQVMPSA